MNPGLTLSVTRAFEIFLNALGFFLIARVFSLDSLGDFYSAYAGLMIVQVVSAFGLNAGISAEYKRTQKNRTDLVSSVYATRVIIILIIAVISLFVDISPDLKTLFVVFCISEIFKTSVFINFILEYELQFNQVAFSRIVTVIGGFLARVIVIWFEQPLLILCMTYIFEGILVFLFEIHFCKKLDVAFSAKSIDLKLIKPLIQKYFPLLISGITQVLILRTDIFMVSYFLDQKSVALYGFALRLAEMPVSFAAVFAGVFYARALNLKTNTVNHLNYISRRYLLGFMLAFCLGATLIYLVHMPVLDLFFGKKFQGAYTSLMILLFATLMLSVRQLISKHILIVDLFSVSIMLNVCAFLMNVGLNKYLIPIFGIEGAALATVISLIVSFCMVLLLLDIGRPVFKSLVGITKG